MPLTRKKTNFLFLQVLNNFREIAIFNLELSSKAQIRPLTIKMDGLVLEFAISVRSHPLSDAVYPTVAHSVSTVLFRPK